MENSKQPEAAVDQAWDALQDAYAAAEKIPHLIDDAITHYCGRVMDLEKVLDMYANMSPREFAEDRGRKAKAMLVDRINTDNEVESVLR